MENPSEGDNAQEELIHNGDVKKEDADEFANDKLPILAPDLLRAPCFCDFSFPF
jgi:hypothetical protein